MTDERGDLDVLRSAEHDLCRVAPRGGACIAAWQSRAAAGMPRWSVGERKLGAGIVRKVAPVASHWKPFAGSDLQAPDRGRRRRRRRANLKRKITIRRKPNSRFKGAPEIAGMMFKPKSWNKARRYVIKRTPIVDKDDQQLYLDDGLRRYVYWIVVSNSKRSNEQVLRIAQGRGNQENLIKDFKYGLGLAHIPTGSLAANQAYFMIAALAWNLKTWLLNLLHLGDGAVMRFQRFRYQWIWQAGTVAKSGRNTVVLKLPAGEYFQRFGVALARLATL